MNLKPVEFIDQEGRKRRVLVPDGATTRPEEGIPVSLDLDEVFPDAPADFLARLHNELWARGLVEPQDFLKAGAPEAYKRALLSVIRLDFARIRQLAQEVTQHG